MKRLLALIYLLISNFNVGALSFWDSHQAYQYYQKEDYVNAAKHCEKLLLTAPNDLTNLINMGNVLYKQGHYLQAANYFEQAVKQVSINEFPTNDSQKTEIWFGLGSAYAQQEKWQTALDAYDEVVKINPAHERALKNIEIIKKLLEKEKEKEKEDQKKEEQNKKEQDQKEQDQKEQDQKEQDQQDQQNDKQSKDDQSRDNKQDRQQKNNDQVGKQSQARDSQNQKSDDDRSGKEQTGKQNTKTSVAGQTETDDQLKKSQQEMEKLNQARLATLSEQEKEYLAAVEQTDQRANRYLMQMQNVQGSKNENSNNW